jgi:hypothetical protein
MLTTLKNFSLFALAITLSFAFLSPKVRKNLGLFPSQQRSVLAAIPVKYGADSYKIIKLKQGPHILIEIYRQHGLESELYAQFELQNRKDIYYDFKTSVTNMFIANIDEDQTNEILVPLLNQNLDSEISIIKYASSDKKFSIY